MELFYQEWLGYETPTEKDIREELSLENLEAYRWKSHPGEIFENHTHGYHKILYVVSGSIKLNLPAQNKTFSLKEGDRLNLPAGTRHNATVGIDGVVCLEAHIH